MGGIESRAYPKKEFEDLNIVVRRIIILLLFNIKGPFKKRSLLLYTNWPWNCCIGPLKKVYVQ